ncbi:MAG: pitrilysin family protein [Xenococcaceae cyanobacterium MO_188.B29]|nr:pitrilysin family protein [Xenococcaceae cyanobacterium MO_188.B29]
MSKSKSKKIINWLNLGIITVLALFFLRLPATAQTPKHYTELEFSPPPEVQLPQYERYQLDNGMVVYLVEDHDLPLVEGKALIRTGSRYEPADKVGLAQLVGTVMRSGGTESHSAERLNSILEQKAASIETQIGNTSADAGFSSLTEDLETVFKLYAEVIREPAFAEEQIVLAKRQQEGAIARRNDNPGDIARREFNKLIYGEKSPYARTVEYDTLNNIAREDIVSFYQQYIRPDSIIMGIVGDFESTAMKALIEETFADWQALSISPQLNPPDVTQKHEGGIFTIDRPDLTQSNILLGHIGGTLKNPDYPQLSVLNGVMNGFGGRLFDEVRSRQGLAYSVYGVWNPHYDYQGTFFAGGQTRTDATVPFVKSIVSEIKKLRSTPITEEELANAKESILNSFVFNFQNPSQTLSRLMRYEYYDYPADFIFQYQEGVKATTVEDIQRVAQKYLQPEKLVTLIVGNTREIGSSINNLGAKVQTVDISIPQLSRS